MKPYIWKDTFWADVINRLLLHPVYRRPELLPIELEHIDVLLNIVQSYMVLGIANTSETEKLKDKAVKELSRRLYLNNEQVYEYVKEWNKNRPIDEGW